MILKSIKLVSVQFLPGILNMAAKECVAIITCLYKHSGAVSCVGGNLLFFPPAPWCTTMYTQYFDTKLHLILSWADIIRKCNTFLLVGMLDYLTYQI